MRYSYVALKDMKIQRLERRWKGSAARRQLSSAGGMWQWEMSSEAIRTPRWYLTTLRRFRQRYKLVRHHCPEAILVFHLGVHISPYWCRGISRLIYTKFRSPSLLANVWFREENLSQILAKGKRGWIHWGISSKCFLAGRVAHCDVLMWEGSRPSGKPACPGCWGKGGKNRVPQDIAEPLK